MVPFKIESKRLPDNSWDIKVFVSPTEFYQCFFTGGTQKEVEKSALWEFNRKMACATVC